MAASILVCHRSYLISAAVSHSQCITNSVCDLYQRGDVCMRQMFQEAEETEAMNEWIIGLTKRSYRYRILSPVICLLSLPYLARQKYTLSRTAGVCMNVEPLQIILLFNFFVLHLDRLLLFVGAVVISLLGCSSACNSGTDSSALFCVTACCCRWRWRESGELLLILRALEFMQTQYDHPSKHTHTHNHTHMQGHTLLMPHTQINTHTVSAVCPNLGALTTIKMQRCQMCFPMFPVLRICSECVEKGKGICTHTHTAASQKYTGLLDNEGGQGGIITSHHNNIILLTTPAASSMTVWHFHFTRV